MVYKLRTPQMKLFHAYSHFFQTLNHGLKEKCDIARKPENKLKNRYGNIVACK